MKKKEWIMIILLAVLAAAALIWMKYKPVNPVDPPVSSETAEPTADPDGSVPLPEEKPEGEWIAVVNRKRVLLYFDSGVDGEYEVFGNVGHMIIEVKDDMWHVKEVDCYDYTCQHMGWIGLDSILPIICLPNDIVIIDAATASEMITR